MGISTIIFDFDGVILESVSIKSEAFKKLFSFVPDHVDEIVGFHIENGGMSRFEKFQYIYKNIIKEDLTDEQFQFLSEQFTQLVLENILNAPFVEGARSFLERYHSKLHLYIVSATPDDELKFIVKKRQLEPYFKGVYGSPTKKYDNIKTILDTNNQPKDSMVYVGDAINDWQAAQSAGIAFIARIPKGDINHFKGRTGVVLMIQNLCQLEKFVEENQ